MIRSAPFALTVTLTALSLGGCAPGGGGASDPDADTGQAAPQAASFVPYAEDGLSVASLDPARYLGLWYEIATTPSFIQADCHATTAEYGVVDEDTVSVYNRCHLGSPDGELSEIEGTADFVDERYARLLVDFGFGFAAPYNVVELDGAEGDAPYRYAAVNSAGMQIWILARAPTLDPALYDTLVERMAAQELPTDDLVLTEHAAD